MKNVPCPDRPRVPAACFNIGEASELSGVSAKMIRHYEDIGLIPKARRSASGYRMYQEDDVHMLRFVKRGRELGFAMKEVQRLLGLWKDRRRASGDVKRLALDHIAGLDARIAQLRQMRRTLDHLARECHGDRRPHCPILDDLAGRQQ